VHELLLPFAELVVAIGSPPFGSLGAVARYLGLAAAAANRPAQAIAHLESALALNERIGALPQLAHTRADLAGILAAGSAPERERAAELVAAARETAQQLGMRGLLERLAMHPAARHAATLAPAPAADAGEPGAAVPAPSAAPADAGERRRATCRREGDFWTIAHAGHTARLRDAKGFALLCTLLRHPGREFHVLELESGSIAPTASPGAMAAAGLAATRGGDAGDVLDASARSAYRARLRTLQAELAAADGDPDPGRREGLEREIEFLTGELSRGVGLGGRSRKAASASERARLNVTRSLGRAIRRIAEAHPTLGEHLGRAVKTGTYCSYGPDPGAALRWEL
jgi:hypothetical protein